MLAPDRLTPVARNERGLQIGAAGQVRRIHKAQAVLRAHIGASAAENAFVAIEHRAYMAL